MGDIIADTIEDNVKAQKLELLRTMNNDVDECFDNFSDEHLWQVKNFIESYMREIV